MRIASVGHATFTATLIAIGILGLIKGNFTLVWEGVPKSLPVREALAYLCTFISLVCGIGLFWRRATAARVLFVYLLPGLMLFKASHSSYVRLKGASIHDVKLSTAP